MDRAVRWGDDVQIPLGPRGPSFGATGQARLKDSSQLTGAAGLKSTAHAAEASELTPSTQARLRRLLGRSDLAAFRQWSRLADEIKLDGFRISARMAPGHGDYASSLFGVERRKVEASVARRLRTPPRSANP